MDSMRALNTSLPATSSSQRQASQPPEQLLQAFKSAALSVTNLYKTAASEQSQIRAAGYQDALDDLLAFLDRENLGLGDGEGWRVRQWATERLDSGVPGQSSADTDEESEEQKRARSSSPAVIRRNSQDELRQSQAQRLDSSTRTGSAPPCTETIRANSPSLQARSSSPRTETFTFRSPLAYPQTSDVDMDATNNNGSSTPALRLEVLPRNARNSPRHRQHGRPSHRAPTSITSLGSGAGQKRKAPFQDFFDISGFFNDKEATNGGGKRGRHA
ncbi:hypothetical protein EV356DRAFT_529451 [Viridothelium virens]|uniref:Uncharacterized protein n=1 Tax=Viridothelium virens TaxID=1048519 RepID=A0A6A6HJ15_VIRVR|nr:hypothetical protein EV356DRAFT_529451 [Viridothelium virens]